MSIIYDLLQAYAEQTALVSQATNKIEAQKKDIAHLLKHNSALEDELYKLRDEVKRAARNRQLKAERWKAKRRKRGLKRKYGGDLSVANWEYSYNITRLYGQWQRLRTTNPPLAQALRERLNEWKEAHRVKTP